MYDSVRPHRRQPIRLLCPRDSPGKNTGVGCHGSNPSQISSLYFNLISRPASGGVFLFDIYNKSNMCNELWRREAQSKVTVHRALISLTASGKLKNYKGNQVQTTSSVRSLEWSRRRRERLCGVSELHLWIWNLNFIKSSYVTKYSFELFQTI